MNKICKSCGETLPINSFGKSKLPKDGYENKCKNTEKQFHEFMEKYANTELSGGESH